MATSPLKRLLVHTSHYSLSSLLTMIAGLVSFPLLTRIFSVSEYGVMSLIGATLSVSVAIGKVGLQHSIVRFRSEIAAGKSNYTSHQLYSTTIYGMSGSALAVMALLIVGLHVVPEGWLGGSTRRSLFTLASTLILVQVIDSAFTNFLRAEQQTVALMRYQVLKRYLVLALVVTTVLSISPTLSGFYSATLVGEGLAVGALAWVFFRSTGRGRPSLAAFSRPLYRRLLVFGIPMLAGYELSGLALLVGDRYVIEGIIGEEPLGLYSAAYNLCQYVQAVVIASVGQAIMPLYMQMWDEKGADETSAFISRSLRTYVLLGAPVVAGIAAVGPELLPSLASDKYASAGTLLPWIIAGMVVDGANSMVGAGLFIHRKTVAIMSIVLACGALNIGLNLTLIPRIGILGSAIATLVSYSGVALSLALVGRRLLLVRLPWLTLLRAGTAAVIMYFALENVLPGRRFLTVGVRVVLGAPIYGLLIALLDPDGRALTRKMLLRFRRRGAEPAL